jgi:hypothetical protein
VCKGVIQSLGGGAIVRDCRGICRRVGRMEAMCTVGTIYICSWYNNIENSACHDCVGGRSEGKGRGRGERKGEKRKRGERKRKKKD